jgi:hypothetical protein
VIHSFKRVFIREDLLGPSHTRVSSGSIRRREIARGGHEVQADWREWGTSTIDHYWLSGRSGCHQRLECARITLDPHGRLGVAILAYGSRGWRRVFHFLLNTPGLSIGNGDWKGLYTHEWSRLFRAPRLEFSSLVHVFKWGSLLNSAEKSCPRSSQTEHLPDSVVKLQGGKDM